jgi:Na+/proline symporter
LVCSTRSAAARSLEEYFISGRKVTWWLAGASMVATTFAADTPLVVTGIVAANGVAGNWLWWNMLMSGMLTVFFFARLWRRANVMTDVEFAEIRYSGNRAAFLRGFRALYLAIPINLIILGWVTRAMIKILTISLGLRDVQIAGMTVSGEVIAGRYLFSRDDVVLGRRGHVGGAVDGSRAVRDQDVGGDHSRCLRGSGSGRHGGAQSWGRGALRQ